jgi:hypothetical protein
MLALLLRTAWLYSSLKQLCSNINTNPIDKNKLNYCVDVVKNYHLSQFFLAIIISVQMSLQAKISTKLNKIDSIFEQIKAFVRNNIIVFEYLFFGQVTLTIIKANSFLPELTNIYLVLTSFVFVLMALSQLNCRNINNAILKFLIKFFVVFLSFLVINTSIFSI